MKFFALLPFVAAVLAVPTKRQQCTNPAVRVEWRSLNQEQKDSFHKAVKCLQTKPGEKKGESLFDWYSRLHVDMFGEIHYVAAFLPWHRYYAHARDISLQKCGYEGPITYWDWTRDTTDMANSKIFHATEGFGGNGGSTSRGGKSDKCVQDGPYGTKSGFNIAYPEKRCLQRSFNMNGSKKSWWSQEPSNGPEQKHSSSVIHGISQNEHFVDFWRDLEEGPHDAVHNEVAGDMAAAFSPDDPLFFKHHINVDRIWALWQGRNATRLGDYRGNTIQGQRVNDGTRFPLASLDDKISLRGLQGMPDVTVRDLMDTQGGVLCYKYDQ